MPVAVHAVLPLRSEAILPWGRRHHGDAVLLHGMGKFLDWLLIGQLATTCRSSVLFVANESVATKSRLGTYFGTAWKLGNSEEKVMGVVGCS